MKILTLRIYNSTIDYDQMYMLHKEYDKNSIYLTTSQDTLIPIYDENTKILTIPGSESLIPGILEKTINGIDYCLKNFEFDILVRSNMSTVVDYNELEKQLCSIGRPYGGHIWGFNLRGSYFNFVSGSCIVMNKEICNYLIDNKNNLIYELSDDVAIGKLLSEKFPITFSTTYNQTNTICKNTCFYRFRNNLERYDCRENDIKNMRRFYQALYTVIITSITNNIDSIKNSGIPNIEIYTDSSLFPRKDLHPRLQSKYFKMCGHSLFPDKKYIIWVDGSVQITQEIVYWLIEFMGNTDCAFIQHHARNRVIDELTHVEDEMKNGNKYLLDRYQHEPMRSQVESYIKEDFVDDKLLFGAIFIRKNDPKVNVAFDNWFIENVKWSIQDQLSLPYIIWKYQLSVSIIPASFYWGGPYHKYIGHSI